MTTVRDIYDYLNQLAPVGSKMDFDNVGLLCGHTDRPVSRVLTSLDITDPVMEEAKQCGAELIVSHHPLFFGLKSVSDQTPEGKKILFLAENGIAAICMHTNLDVAEQGVNTALAKALKLQNADKLEPSGLGAYGTLENEMSMPLFLQTVRETLHPNGLRYVGHHPVRKVAVVGGSGGESYALASSLGCDTLVTADVKYHQFLSAEEMGMNLIDADHFSTENPVMASLTEKLRQAFPQVQFSVSEVHGPVIRFF